MATVLIDGALRYLRIPSGDWGEERIQASRSANACFLKLAHDRHIGVRSVTVLEMKDMVENLDITFLGMSLSDFDWQFEWRTMAMTNLGSTSGFPQDGTCNIQINVSTDIDEYDVLGTLLHELVHVYINGVLYEYRAGSLSHILAWSVDFHEQLTRHHGELWQNLACDVEEAVSKLLEHNVDLGRPAAIIEEVKKCHVRPDTAFLETLFHGQRMIEVQNRLELFAARCIWAVIKDYRQTKERPDADQDADLLRLLGAEGFSILQTKLDAIDEQQKPTCEDTGTQQALICESTGLQQEVSGLALELQREVSGSDTEEEQVPECAHK